MKIDLNEILDRHLYIARVQTDGPVDEREATINAMKEACGKILELASEVKFQSQSITHTWSVGIPPAGKAAILNLKDELS